MQSIVRVLNFPATSTTKEAQFLLNISRRVGEEA